ncbi:MAG: condensation domain-containing protein, partial [Deltaproteobacteria bacterium]
HIVTDGWSAAILFRELTVLYDAYAQGRESPLADLVVQYADFAEWQREFLQGETLAELQGYWREKLAGAPATVELPLDRQRPAVQRHRGADHTVALASGLMKKLGAISQDENATLFVTLLAAFNVLMARYSGQTDIVVGTAIANRNREEVEALIGFFVNSLVLRTDVSGNPTFAEVIQRTRTTALESYAHQDLPFEQLVAMLQPDRDPSRNPLFQVMFILQSAPTVRVEVPGLLLEADETDTGSTRHDLRFSIEELTGDMVCKVTYNTDLFDADTIARLTESFAVLLEASAADPRRRIADLPVLPEAERTRLLVDFNRTEAPFPEDALLHELFTAQVPERGDADAVIFGRERVSYRELDRRARRIAHVLVARAGVKRNTLVAVMMQKGVDPVAAMLGIHMAGAAYLPIDPHLPRERVEYLLSHAGAQLVLTQSWLEPLVDWPEGAVRLAADQISLEPGDPGPVARLQGSRDLAYVIYTSGSTGKPKGVAIDHRGAVNTVLDVNRRHGIGPHDRVLALSAFNFDLSVYDVFG